MWLIISHVCAGVLGGLIAWACFELGRIEVKTISKNDTEFISKKLKLFDEN